jgi:phenylacetate-CoA ligase
VKTAFSRKNLWEKTPSALKAVAGRGLSPVPLSYLLGRRFRAERRFIDQMRHWSAENARTYQLQKLRTICELAWTRSPFYRDHFSEAGFTPDRLRDTTDLQALATIDRHTIATHGARMRVRSVAAPDVDQVSTAGTSGQPVHFYQQADRSFVEYAYLTESWRRAGFTLGTPLAVLRGRVVRPDRRGLRHEYDPLLRHHYYSVFHMSDENMGRYLKHIRDIGPCFLHVYPSAVAALARFCRRTGVRTPDNIRGIIAESEIVYPGQRAMVEETFGCRYFSCYGHTEKLVLAAECEHSTDYHVWPTYGYFELLDEWGRPVTTPGQRGEIVGTGFTNAVMPFIRFRTGDWATYVGPRCEACGREHTIIRDIHGHRTQEVLIAADRSEIPWVALNLHDDALLRVRQFQFFQELPGRAVLRIVPADGFGEGDIVKIHRNLDRKLDGRLAFTVECVDAIPLSPRGKAIYVDQRIPRAADGRAQ